MIAEFETQNSTSSHKHFAELLSHYGANHSRSSNSFDKFRRLNETLSLILDEDLVPDSALLDFHRALKASAKSAIDASNKSNSMHSAENSSNIGELMLNLLQIEKEIRRRKLTLMSSISTEFDAKIRKGVAWVEKTYLDKTTPSFNTFFLPVVYEKVISHPQYFNNPRKNSEFSADILEDVLSAFEREPFYKDFSKNHQIVSAFGRHEPDLFKKTLFTHLAAIHHEVSENALSHAVRSKINDRSNTSSNDSDFGSIFYAQITTFRVPVNMREVSKFNSHPDFQDYHRSILGKKFGMRNRQSKMYFSISYCDTGLGIQNHMSKFANEHTGDSKNISLDSLIEAGATTRDFSGSGFGLKKTKLFSRLLDGFLTIDTPNSSFSYNGFLDEKPREHNGRTRRGTMISITVPV